MWNRHSKSGYQLFYWYPPLLCWFNHLQLFLSLFHSLIFCVRWSVPSFLENYIWRDVAFELYVKFLVVCTSLSLISFWVNRYVSGGLYLPFLRFRFPFFLLSLFYLIYEKKSSIKWENYNKKPPLCYQHKDGSRISEEMLQTQTYCIIFGADIQPEHLCVCYFCTQF